jgi:hypothetical protein
LPLVYQSNLQYIGGFRLPSTVDGSNDLNFAGQGLAFNPANNSLFLTGADQSLANVSIPSSIVNSSNLANLATASYVQPTINIQSKIPNTSNLQGKNGISNGGLMVVNGQLIGTLYTFYDTSGATYETHYRIDSLNLSSATVEGMFEVGGISLAGGTISASGAADFYAGYMSPIPANWQSAFGAPDLTGNCCTPILSRTSFGPAAFGFNPSTLSTSSVTTATPYLYYTQNNEAGGFDGNTRVNGVEFVPGSRTVLFFGSVGTNQQEYGNPSSFNDPYRPGKGYHSLNGDYAYQVWAYDANDLLAVKAGKLQPWQVQPYATWNFDFPQFEGAKDIGGVAFDPSTDRLYVTELGADTSAPYTNLPVVQVFQLTLNSAGTGGSPQAVIAPANGASLQTSVATPTVTSASTTTTTMDVTPASGITSGSQNTPVGTVPEFDGNQAGSVSVSTGSAAPLQQRQPLPSGPRFASKAKAVKPPQTVTAQTPIVFRHIVVNDGGPVRPLLGSHDANGE